MRWFEEINHRHTEQVRELHQGLQGQVQSGLDALEVAETDLCFLSELRLSESPLDAEFSNPAPHVTTGAAETGGAHRAHSRAEGR